MRAHILPAAQAAVLAVSGVAILTISSAAGTPRLPIEPTALAADTLRPVAAFTNTARADRLKRLFVPPKEWPVIDSPRAIL